MFKIALLATGALAAGWDQRQADISFDLSLASYCGHEQVLDYPFSGSVEGFVATKAIWNPENELTGYLGYLPSDQSIWVVFRGTVGQKNWDIDFDSVKVDYELWPECKGCKVHRGFNDAINSVADLILTEVGDLK